jgi:hypothetical protein
MPITNRRRRDALPSALFSAVLALAGGGCMTGPLSPGNAAQPHLELKVYPISCEDGRRYAAKTLKNRGYRITKVSRDGATTVVDGENKAERFSSTVSVTCGAGGVTMTPYGSTMWVVDGLRFSYHQIAETGDKVWPLPTGPVVKMEFYAGEEAKIEFPTAIEPLGVVAVRVQVLNAGDRTLRVDPRHMKVVTETGAVSGSIADGEKKLAGSDPDIKSKVLKTAKLKKGESVTGFVFFPVGTYTGGSIALIDDQTGEADDFDVTFGSS